MNRLKNQMSAVAMSVLALVCAGTVRASDKKSAGTVDLVFLPESTVQIDGDSSVRKYSAKAAPVTLTGKAKPNPDSAGGLPWTPTEVDMSIAVKDLKSGERTLDKHMDEALKAEQAPVIDMKLTSFKFVPKDGAGPGSVRASGSLTVAGVTKPIELKPVITSEGANLRIQGTQRLLMSEFGITPPTLMMGTLKTRDEISVNYNVVCAKGGKDMANR